MTLFDTCVSNSVFERIIYSNYIRMRIKKKNTWYNHISQFLDRYSKKFGGFSIVRNSKLLYRFYFTIYTHDRTHEVLLGIELPIYPTVVVDTWSLCFTSGTNWKPIWLYPVSMAVANSNLFFFNFYENQIVTLSTRLIYRRFKTPKLFISCYIPEKL